MSATRSPSADDRSERRIGLPRRLRRLLPRTFQGRLTGAFLAVVALTLLLTTVLVINRLDDYFTSQQRADLMQRAKSVFQSVDQMATSATNGGPVVGPDNEVAPIVLLALANHNNQRFLADQLGQADVQLTFGQVISNGEGSVFMPANGGPITINLGRRR